MSFYTMSLIYFINPEIYKDIVKPSKYNGMLQAIKCQHVMINLNV